MKAALDLFGGLGVASLDCRQDGAKVGGGERGGYLFNSTIAGLENHDAILIVGANPRTEAPLLNARIRKIWGARNASVGLIGEGVDLSYPYEFLGAGPADLGKFLKSKKGFIEVLKAAKNPAIIVGSGAIARDDGAAVLAQAAQAAKALGATLNVLHTAASRVGGLDLGFLPRAGGQDAKAMVAKGGADLLFLMGADEIDVSQSKAFVVYMGTHGDAGAHRADVILPGAAYTEKSGLYVNIEGRVQLANRAVFPKGEAKEDWAILRALSEVLGAKLPYDSLDELRAKLFADHPTFGAIDYVAPAQVNLDAVGAKGEVGEGAFVSPIVDFYLTNPIARASVTMAECSQLRSGATKMAAE